MEILKGTLLNVFKNERTFTKEEKEVVITEFKASLTKKVDEGIYERMPIKVSFAGDLGKKAEKFEVNKCYEVEIGKAFLSFDSWVKDDVKQYRLIVVITEGKCKSVKDVKPKDNPADDLPF